MTRPRLWGETARANARAVRAPSHRKVSAIDRIRRWTYEAGWRACAKTIAAAIESAIAVHEAEHGRSTQQSRRAAVDADLARQIGARPR